MLPQGVWGKVTRDLSMGQSHRAAQLCLHGKEKVKDNQRDKCPNLAEKQGPVEGSSSPVCPGKPPGPGDRRRERLRSWPGCVPPAHRPRPAPQLLTLQICSCEYSCISAQKTNCHDFSIPSFLWMCSTSTGAAAGAEQLPSPQEKTPPPIFFWAGPQDRQLPPHPSTAQ